MAWGLVIVKNATDVRRAAYFSRKLVLAEKYRMNGARFQGARGKAESLVNTVFFTFFRMREIWQKGRGGRQDGRKAETEGKDRDAIGGSPDRAADPPSFEG